MRKREKGLGTVYDGRSVREKCRVALKSGGRGQEQPKGNCLGRGRGRGTFSWKIWFELLDARRGERGSVPNGFVLFERLRRKGPSWGREGGESVERFVYEVRARGKRR